MRNCELEDVPNMGRFFQKPNKEITDFLCSLVIKRITCYSTTFLGIKILPEQRLNIVDIHKYKWRDIAIANVSRLL